MQDHHTPSVPIVKKAGAISLGVVAAAAAAIIVVAPPAVSETTPVIVPASLAEPVTVPLTEPRPTVADVDTARRAAAAEQASRAAAARQSVAVRQAAFASFTLTSEQATDLRGVEPSLYRGRYFTAASEKKRLCIVERESEGFYDVVNPGGNYFGAYQVSRALAEGVTYMMAKEHKELLGEERAKDVLARLRETPMNTWSRYWQDAAFHTIINWEGSLSGASHWAGGRWTC